VWNSVRGNEAALRFFRTRRRTMQAKAKKSVILAVVLTVAVMFIFGVIGALVVANSGWIDVSATNGPSRFMVWFLTTTRNHSIETRAQDIDVPDLSSPRMRDIGADHYQEMCVGCHGAPGVQASEAAQGMEPSPPKLYQGEEMTRLELAETFWVVKNGIQMTAMPAFGKTHDDEKIWALVAFVRQLPGMTPADYHEAMEIESGAGSGDDPGVADEHAEHEHHELESDL